MVPATKEPMAAVARAAAPLPERAILLPSSAVIIEPDSPGVLIRMDVVEPPYMAPYSTPANMMKADVGATEMVTGSNSAMVSAGPIPGRTPIAVPSTEPSNAHIRLVGCSATEKPCSRSSKDCMSEPRYRQKCPELQPETGEQEPGSRTQNRAVDEVEQRLARRK